MWLEEDPVHLTAAAYMDIASHVQNRASIVTQGKPTPGWRRIDSIVPAQGQVLEPAMLREPGWINHTDNVIGGRGRGG